MPVGLVTIIHNKSTDAANRAQITFFNSNTTKTAPDSQLYTINGIDVSFKISYLQIIPQGVTIPTNLNLLNHYYLEFKNDRPNSILRYYNVAVRRASQFPAIDVIITVTDHTLITLTDFRNAMQEIAGNKILVERSWGRVFEVKIFQKISNQLTESGLTLQQAIDELKTRITNAGYTYG